MFGNLEDIVEIKRGQVGRGLLIENDGFIKGESDMISQIKEDINNGHKFIIPEHFVVDAVFQKYGVKNANGRVYPEAMLRRAVNEYIEERVNNRCALGALDHPTAQSALSGHDVSHNILSLEWDGCTLVGQMELHLTPGYIKYGVCSTSGDLVANMLLSNYLIGVSSRGLGTVERKGDLVVVNDDFSIICWDVVLEPSTPGAYIKSNREDLQPFIEQKTNVIDFKENPVMNDRLSRINQILGFK